MADQPAGSHHPPQPELVPAPAPEADDENDHNDSALGSVDSLRSSTASLTSSILNYRTFHGRTYHSDRYNVDYFTPNDEQQLESINISYYYLSIILDNRLYLAPIKKDIQKAVDIGTGTGIWAIWPNNTFDFVHMRYLFGAIIGWDLPYQQAYRCCKPEGWFESCEIDPLIYSDDGTTNGVYAVERWNELFREAGKKTGRSFAPVEDNLQANAIKDAGFVHREQANYKVPLGPWAADKKLKEIGQFAQFAMDNDLDGYTMHIWHNVLNWPKEEYPVFLMSVREYLKNRSIHGYMSVRIVYGRKPKDEVSAT
ncbi:S-adenosyl-L-methionine-dependent methyltransferase [Pleurostoma richardsiae]|uniref:S-adenosyl-L-methionine-dependent methyltransferase n=1 Tax=Pleurostoma richardsiae TaxID=41990 RepID=A0AA38RJ43_9PEZI|nr:S-adenosyl-L-methionine-dependent methyltransferase [Pleurostoma richardsiae]